MISGSGPEREVMTHIRILVIVSPVFRRYDKTGSQNGSEELRCLCMQVKNFSGFVQLFSGFSCTHNSPLVITGTYRITIPMAHEQLIAVCPKTSWRSSMLPLNKATGLDSLVVSRRKYEFVRVLVYISEHFSPSA